MIKIKKGGDEARFYDGKLIQGSRTNIINERRDVYGLMTKRCDIVLKTLRKDEKQ